MKEELANEGEGNRISGIWHPYLVLMLEVDHQLELPDCIPLALVSQFGQSRGTKNTEVQTFCVRILWKLGKLYQIYSL